jgi:tRNA-Thr(GGU) m(6)t(6)A37 methyltransferase TsaA
METIIKPIGIIHSPYPDPEGVPIQSVFAKDVRGRVEVLPEFAEGLTDLDGFSHIILLYCFHKSTGYSLKCKPFLDTCERGIFATRAPRRPNPIGISVVRLLGIRDTVLDIAGVDIVDGTPLFDIKPYVSDFDSCKDVKNGWYELAGNRTQTVADNRFIQTEKKKG